MLFPNLAEETVLKTIKTAREENKRAQRGMINKLIDYYENAQLEYLDQYDGFRDDSGAWLSGKAALDFEAAPSFNRRGKWLIPPAWFNITQQVIDRISMAYKFPPDRMLKQETREDQDVEEQDEYNQWIDRYPTFNLTLNSLEKYVNLLGKALFRPVFDETKKRWKFYVECEYEAHFLEDDPLSPVAYSIPMKIDTSATPRSGDSVWYMFISDEYYFMYTNDGQVKYDDLEGVNPFGIIPLVEFRKSIPVNYYDTSGAIDLVQANESINVAMMNLNMMLHFQAFDQMYETSGSTQEQWKNMQVGANRVWHLPEGSTASLIGFNPKINESVDAIRAQIELIGRMYNLKINWTVEGAPASGFSLIVQNIDLLEARQRDIEIYKVYEQQVYDVLSTMQNYLGNMIDSKEPKLPKDGEVIIDFQEWDFPIDHAEERERWEWEIKMNASSVVDYIQSKEGLSEDEAIDRFMRNKELNKKYTSLADRFSGFGGVITEEEPEEIIEDEET